MPAPGAVVVATTRADLRTAVARLAALVGAEVEPVASSAAARAVWRSARVLVVGADLAPAVAAATLPKRARLVVVSDREPDASLWRAAVALGATHVLELPADEPVLADVLGAALDTEAIDGRVIAVVGGCGGAGASTFAAGLALTSASRVPTMLVDGDPLGGGLDVLLGAEQAAGARWLDLTATKGRLGATALATAVVSVGRLSLLSSSRGSAEPVSTDAARAVMAAAARGFAMTVVDLPRELEPASLELAATADVVVMIVPATVRATAAAMSLLATVRHVHRELRLVVRDPDSGQLAAAEVGEALGLAVLAAYRSEQSVIRAADRGQPPLRRARGSLHHACEHVLAELPAATRVAA